MPLGLVDQAPEFGEKSGLPVHFVNNNQPILLLAQEQPSVGEFGLVKFLLHVEVKMVWIKTVGDFQRQGGLTDLAWPEQGDRWELMKPL